MLRRQNDLNEMMKKNFFVVTYVCKKVVFEFMFTLESLFGFFYCQFY